MEPTILAIDTATENCSVALRRGSQVWQRQALSPREHSQRVLGFITEVLAEAKLNKTDITGIVASIGPGSFTGVRIGVSVAQGLAFSLQVPVVGVSTLAALAQRALRELGATRVVAAIDARMKEVYLAQYELDNGQLKCVVEPRVGPPDHHWLAQQLVGAEGLVAVGTGSIEYASAFSAFATVHEQLALPQAEDFLTLGWAQLQQRQQGAELAGELSANELEPLYVRNEVTWQKITPQVKLN